LRRTAGALAALFLFVGPASGCAPATHTGSSHTFVIAQTSEPRSLDPLLTSGYGTEEIGSLVYSYLVRIDARGGLEPDLAARVPSLYNGDISPDGLTIVYHLRHGVRWQDGVQFTAADVLATYRAIMDSRNAVPTRLGFDRIARISAPDPYTLRIHLTQRFAPFLTYFFETENYPVLPAHVLAHAGALAGSALDAMPVGTGPYRVVEWQHGEYLDLAANDHYFGGAPHIAHLRIAFVPSAITIAQQLRTGDADAYLAADPFVLDQLRADTRLRLDTVPIYGFISLSMQTQDPALRVAAVRRAIAHIFDFDRAVRDASHGALDSRDAGRGLFTWAYVDAPIPPSFVSLPSQLSLSIDATRPLEKALAEIMQAEAHAKGMTILIRAFAPQQFEATAAGTGPLASGSYQLALHEVITGADPETTWILSCSQFPPAGYNVSRYCDPQVESALADALTTNDVARRKRDYALVQQLVARDAPFVPVAQLREIEAIPATMTGFAPSLETPFFHPERWRL